MRCRDRCKRYPTCQRLWGEESRHHGECLNFRALGRFADVEAALKGLQRLISAKGHPVEVAKTNSVMVSGVFINAQLPLYTVRHVLVSRALTWRKMKTLEEKIHAFCVVC